MGKYKAYAKYKDSGIPWLGEIPEHWDVRSIKSIGEVINGATPTTSEREFWDGNIVWITPAEINNVVYINDSRRKITELGYRNCGASILPKHSIILTTRAPIGKVAIANINLCTNQGCKSIVPKFIDYKFFYYSIQIRTKELNNLGTGTTFMELGTSVLKKFPISFPSPSEQTAIARFLDYKLAKINRFIRKKKQLIKLLNEQKAAIINQAVTKGLGANAKTYTIENLWINELPLNYSFESFNKNVFLKHGFQFREEHFSSDGLQVVKITQLSPDGNLRLENASYVPEDYKNIFQDIIINEGDILMALTGGTIGKIIRADINNKILLQNYRVGNFYPTNNKLDKEFLYWQLKSEFIQAQMKFFIRETGQPNIGKGDFRKIHLIIPPLSEQLEIVNFISEQANRIEATISTIEKEIALVEEYKTALIAEAVTGKIDVRDYAVPEVEMEEETYEELEEEMSMEAADAADYETAETA